MFRRVQSYGRYNVDVYVQLLTRAVPLMNDRLLICLCCALYRNATHERPATHAAARDTAACGRTDEV